MSNETDITVIQAGDREVVMELVDRGHTRTCATRMLLHDGVCQCGQIQKMNMHMKGID